MRPQQIDGTEARAVDHEARFDFGGAVARRFHEEAAVRTREALHAAVAHQRAAGIFHVALQRQHVGMLIDDAAGGAEQRRRAAHFGFELVRLGAGDQAHAVDVVDVRALEQVQQHLLFFIAVGDDELAAVVVFDAARLAIGVQGAVAGDTEARLEAARCVVEAGVNDAAVARRGDGARMGLRLEQQHFAAGQRQCARHGEAHHARTDDDAFDPVCHILNLSCKHPHFRRVLAALLLAAAGRLQRVFRQPLHGDQGSAAGAGPAAHRDAGHRRCRGRRSSCRRKGYTPITFASNYPVSDRVEASIWSVPEPVAASATHFKAPGAGDARRAGAGDGAGGERPRRPMPRSTRRSSRTC